MNTAKTAVTPVQTLTQYLPCPPLAHDAMMAKEFGSKVGQIGRADRAVAFNLLRHLHANGWSPVALNDGEEETKLTAEADPGQAALELIFNLDMAWLRVAKGKANHAILLVMGNSGWDLVSDYGYAEGDPDGFEAVMEAFDGEVVLAGLLGGGL